MSTELTIRGACPHDCPDTCGVITEVRDGRAVGFRGDPDHPVTRGWLCAKVRPYLDHVYHPGRLLHPLRRSTRLPTATWGPSWSNWAASRRRSRLIAKPSVSSPRSPNATTSSAFP